MSDPIRLTTQRVFLWRAASWLSVAFALLTLLMPIAVPWAAALVALTLTLGLPNYKSMLQPSQSRTMTVWWLGLGLASILALLAKWMLLTMPVPRFADYLPQEPVSPLQQGIFDNADALYWGASWTAVATTLAGALILPLVLQKLRTSHHETAISVN